MGDLNAPATDDQVLAALDKAVSAHVVIVRPVIAVGFEEARELTVPVALAGTAEAATEYVRELLTDCWTVGTVYPLVTL